MQEDIFMEVNSLVDETIFLSSQGEEMATTDCDVEKAGQMKKQVTWGGGY